jgi:hypothetical protein
MALIALQQSKITGTNTTFTSASASDTIQLIPNAHLHYKSGGTICTITVVVPGNNEDGQPNPDPAIATVATGDTMIGPFSARHADPVTGLITLTTTPITALTVAYVA